MKKRVVVEIERVENGLVLRERTGNTWGPKRFVVTFRQKDEISFNYDESKTIGNIVHEFMFGKQQETAADKPVTLAKQPA